MKLSKELLNQIIEMAEAQDKELSAAYIALNKGSRAVGEGSLLFHLKVLKELIEREEKQLPPPPQLPPSNIVFNNKNFNVAYGTGIGDFGLADGVTGKVTVPLIVEQYRGGCVDTKYCNQCKTVYYSSICVCALWSCEKCGGSLSLLPAEPYNKSEWTRVRR